MIGINLESEFSTIAKTSALVQKDIKVGNISQEDLTSAVRKQYEAKNSRTIRLKSGGEHTSNEAYRLCIEECDASYAACLVFTLFIPEPATKAIAVIACTTQWGICYYYCDQTHNN